MAWRNWHRKRGGGIKARRSGIGSDISSGRSSGIIVASVHQRLARAVDTPRRRAPAQRNHGGKYAPSRASSKSGGVISEKGAAASSWRAYRNRNSSK